MLPPDRWHEADSEHHRASFIVKIRKVWNVGSIIWESSALYASRNCFFISNRWPNRVLASWSTPASLGIHRTVALPKLGISHFGKDRSTLKIATILQKRPVDPMRKTEIAQSKHFKPVLRNQFLATPNFFIFSLTDDLPHSTWTSPKCQVFHCSGFNVSLSGYIFSGF